MNELEWYKKQLSGPLHCEEVTAIVHSALQSVIGKQDLVQLLSNGDERMATNAAWGLMHIKIDELGFLKEHRFYMMDIVMQSNNVSLRRLLLSLLERLSVDDCCEERVDFLDYCLHHMLMGEETVGVRALCIKLAHQMCHQYPELEEEFKQSLLLMAPQTLKPGLLHLRNKSIDLPKEELAINKFKNKTRVNNGKTHNPDDSF